MSKTCTTQEPRPPRRARSIVATMRKAPMLGLAALLLAAAPATADDDAAVKKGGFQLSVGAVEAIVVNVSQDRTEGEILSSPITLQLLGKIDFKRRNGFVERAGLFAGHCKTTDCGPAHTLLWFRSQLSVLSSDGRGLPENDWSINIPVPTTSERLLSPAEQNELIETCKQNPQAEFFHWTTVTLSANTRTRDPSIGEEFSTNDEEFASLDETEFNGGDQSRHADFAVLVSCTLLPYADAPPAPKTPDNQTVGFDHGAMKVNDIRLTLTTFANGYTEPNPGTKCKKARLRVTMETNQQGFASFKLWEQRGDGAIESEDVIVGSHHQDGRFIAVHERWIEVDETTHVRFNARDLINETFNHETGWKDITLHCTGAAGGGLQATPGNHTDDIPVPQPRPRVNPAVGGAVGGLVAKPKPTHAPDRKTAPTRTNPQPKQIVCAGGTVSGGKCRCGQNKILRKTGNRSFQCIAVAKPPEKKKPVRVEPRKAQLVCKGGKASNGKCRCGPNAKRVKIGANAFACQKKAVRANPKPAKKSLICKGGKVRGGKCGCPKGKIARKMGPRAFACVPRRG